MFGQAISTSIEDIGIPGLAVGVAGIWQANDEIGIAVVIEISGRGNCRSLSAILVQGVIVGDRDRRRSIEIKNAAGSEVLVGQYHVASQFNDKAGNLVAILIAFKQGNIVCRVVAEAQ